MAPVPPGPIEAEPTGLVRGAGDLDGDGRDEVIVLYEDGSLVAGSRRGSAVIDELAEARHGSLLVVELDRALDVRALLVTLPTPGAEDPPNRYQLFVPNGEWLEPVLDLVTSNYGINAPSFPGDGSVRYVEDGWTSCNRLGHPSGPVHVDEVVLGFTDDGTMREVARIPGAALECSELAACPFVYVMGDDTSVFAGEILRNLRGSNAYAVQGLELPASQASVLRLRLAEEKLEVTFLDELYLDVDGQRVEPRACTRDGAYCASDRRMHVLRPGDILDIDFELPPTSARLTLFARGYYIPTPTAQTRRDGL